MNWMSNSDAKCKAKKQVRRGPNPHGKCSVHFRYVKSRVESLKFTNAV